MQSDAFLEEQVRRFNFIRWEKYHFRRNDSAMGLCAFEQEKKNTRVCWIFLHTKSMKIRFLFQYSIFFFYLNITTTYNA